MSSNDEGRIADAMETLSERLGDIEESLHQA